MWAHNLASIQLLKRLSKKIVIVFARKTYSRESGKNICRSVDALDVVGTADDLADRP